MSQNNNSSSSIIISDSKDKLPLEDAKQCIWDYMLLGHELKKAEAIVVLGSFDTNVGVYEQAVFCHRSLESKRVEMIQYDSNRLVSVVSRLRLPLFQRLANLRGFAECNTVSEHSFGVVDVALTTLEEAQEGQVTIVEPARLRRGLE